MKKLLSLILCSPSMLLAVDWDCGTYKFSELVMHPLMEKTVTLDSGEQVTYSVPLVALNEKTTDFLTTLTDGDKICVKCSHSRATGGLHYMMFDIKAAP